MPAGIALLLLVIGGVAQPMISMGQDYAGARQQILALGELTTAPAIIPADGFESDDSVQGIYFDSVPYRGKPTKVFGWLGVPAETSGKVPGVVLVHGGGGTAFKDWVKRWNDHGFAAISIAVEGQTDVKDRKSTADVIPTGWKQHEWPGPYRTGIYQDSEKPLRDQWMYHAVAGTVLANSLLRSLPEVDADNVGIMGVSWGGVITSTVIGIDDRFAFAIPTYGCGHLADVPNQYGRSLGGSDLYRQAWDPMQRMGRASMPTLWFSWPGDQHFPLDSQAACYNAAAGPAMVSLVPRMRHGHGPAWNRPESYAFAKSIVQHGAPWCHEIDATTQDGSCRVRFKSRKPLDGAILVATNDGGITGDRKWIESKGTLEQDGQTWVATAALPAKATAWFINVTSGGLVVSSKYQQPAKSLKPNRNAQFATVDKDGDGAVSDSEYADHFAALFDRLDADQNGKLVSSEIANSVAMKLGDIDKDGQLDRKECLSIFRRRFSDLDKNGDRSLTADEFLSRRRN